MPERSRRARWGGAAAVVAAAAVITGLGPAVAADGGPVVRTGEPAEDAPAVADLDVPDASVRIGSATRLRFAAVPGVALELADGRRFLDTLDVTVTGDGQRLVNELTMDDYVAGVAEMPARWHGEALKAQAVAARTYAWYQLTLGTFDDRGYDICDTVDCQVFVGASQEESELGGRWRAAVEATAGEVLLDDTGGPILARYFSTSGGRTLPNEVVFPSSGPRPYLVGTDDPQDAVSPYHRWEVTFTRAQFDTLTAAGSTLAAVTPVTEVERLGPVDVPDAEVRFTGPEGATATLGSVELRRFLSEVAPSRFPDRFPSLRADGLRALPTTIPSSRFEIELDDGDGDVVVRGRGWGHGVGMGQYGALGRAEDGATYDQIVADYYAGSTPQRSDGLPGRVRVGLSRATVGSVRGDAPFTVTLDGEVVTEAGAGTWTLARDGPAIAVDAPPGWGQPARVSRTEPATTLPSGARAVAVAATSATPGDGRLVVRDADGATVADRRIAAVDAGTVAARWDLRDDDGDDVPLGRYEVAVEVVAADGSRDGTPLPVRVTRPPGGDGPVARLGGDAPWRLSATIALLAVGGLVLVAGRRFDAGPSARDARSERRGQEDP